MNLLSICSSPSLLCEIALDSRVNSSQMAGFQADLHCPHFSLSKWYSSVSLTSITLSFCVLAGNFFRGFCLHSFYILYLDVEAPSQFYALLHVNLCDLYAAFCWGKPLCSLSQKKSEFGRVDSLKGSLKVRWPHSFYHSDFLLHLCQFW